MGGPAATGHVAGWETAGAGAASGWTCGALKRRRRKALETTVTELSAIAAAARIVRRHDPQRGTDGS